jgi:nucleotidyltransferase/DNA polymerase involved in DNA repair
MGKEAMKPLKRVARIQPNERDPLVLRVEEKQLIVEHTFSGPEYARHLRRFEEGKVRGKFTLEDLEDMRGFVAAEANHMKEKKLVKRLDALWANLTAVMESYDDGGRG